MTTDPQAGAAEATGAAPVLTPAGYREAHQSPDFVELRSRLRRFVFPMTVVFLGWYLLYVLASGWARGFMGQQVLGEINVAYIFGLLQFVSTFLFAWMYERFANTKLDPLATKVRRDLEERTR